MNSIQNFKAKFLNKSFFTILLSAFSISLHAQQPSLQVSQVADHLYMISGVGGFVGGNMLLSSGDDGNVLIDDSMPPFLDKLRKAVATLSSKPIDFLINTHAHDDHVGNNAAIGSEGAHIVGHENIRRHLLNKGMAGKDGKKAAAPGDALPIITFSESISFHLNDDHAQLLHMPHAHTDGDAVVLFKKANVLHTGDIFFNGMFPFIDLESGGSVRGYIEAQQHCLKLVNDKTTIIPGHGPVARRDDLVAAANMLKQAAAQVEALIASELTEDEVVVRNPLASFHDKWNWGFITTERMTRQLYKGLKTE